MKSIGKAVILIFFIISSLYSKAEERSEDPLILNKMYYSSFLKIAPIKRDCFLDEALNKVLRGRGYIEAVESFNRYNRRFRIILIDSEALKLNIRLYIFTNNEEYLKTLKKGDLFEFNGQFVLYTPLNSIRDSYIFEVILEDGSLMVK